MTKYLHILRPQLPNADSLMPWLLRMEEARWYTNHGPLEQEFRQQLSNHFDGATTVTASNGTTAISLALKSVTKNSPPQSLVMVPAFTFVATALAIVHAGHIPWIVDVDEATWALTPEKAEGLLSSAPGHLAAVVPVAPFGAIADVPLWDAFKDRTGVPVVVDAAACFDSVRPGHCPAVISLHATKAFGVGEGGVVVTRNEKLAGEILWSSNFGFSGDRVSEYVGFNAKMSELTAAMGLAQFECWYKTRDALREIMGTYTEQLQNSPGITFAPGLMDGTPSTMNIRLDKPVDPVIEKLGSRNIEARQWWMKGLECHPSLAKYPKTTLPVTQKLGDTVLGLPLSVDMIEDDVSRVVSALNAK